MPSDPYANVKDLKPRSTTSPASLETVRWRADDLLQKKMKQLSRQFPAYKISAKRLSMGLNSAEISISIDAPAIWRKVKPTKEVLEARLENYLTKKFGNRVQVNVQSGSIEIAIIFALYDIAKVIFEIVNTISVLTEYVIRCIDTGRLEWPPFAAVVGMVDLIRSFFGRLFGQ